MGLARAFSLGGHRNSMRTVPHQATHILHNADHRVHLYLCTGTFSTPSSHLHETLCLFYSTITAALVLYVFAG